VAASSAMSDRERGVKTRSQTGAPIAKRAQLSASRTFQLLVRELRATRQAGVEGRHEGPGSRLLNTCIITYNIFRTRAKGYFTKIRQHCACTAVHEGLPCSTTNS
jgi:hypothetical protein